MSTNDEVLNNGVHEAPSIKVAEAAKIVLADEEVARLEQLADATGIDTRGGWEHTME